MTDADKAINYRILIVDDNKNIHVDFRKILLPQIDTRAIDQISSQLFDEPDSTNLGSSKAYEYRIDSAYQGEEAVNLIEKAVLNNEPYAVAFIDMRMPPGWDGLKTIKEAWKIDPDLQVVMCSAYSDYSWKEISGHLTNTNNLLILKKPFENIEVMQLAQSLTEKWQLIAKLRKRADELSSSQEYLSSTLDSIGDAVIATDSNYKVLRMNPVAEQLTGWSESEAKSISFSNLLPLRDKLTNKAINAPTDQAMKDGKTIKLPESIELVSRSGELIQIAGTVAPIMNINNTAVGIVVGFRDITAQSKIENDRTRLISILESTNDIIATVRMDGQIIYMNKAGIDYFDVGENDNRKLLKTDDFHPRWVVSMIEKTALPTVNDQDIWVGESAIFNKDRKEIPVSQVIMAHYDDYGDIKYYSTIIRDISVLKKAEDEIREFNRTLEVQVVNRTARLEAINFQLQEAKEAADAATVAKSNFLANMSHEIRTPMNGIIAAVDLALGESLTPKMQHYLEIIHSSGYSLLGIINDILDFSKIEAGKLELESKSFNLNDIVYNVAGLFVDQVKSKSIEMIVDVDPHLPFQVLGDPLRLQQVLTNLVGNSFKFTEEFGSIVLKIEASEREQTNNKIWLTFSVEDTGVGLSNEELDKIFQPFTQADTSTTRKFGGTGLGLSISRQLIQMMGGELNAVSEPTKGAYFYFSLPFEKQENADETAPNIPDNLKDKNILIVDDSERSLTILERYLRYYRFYVDKTTLASEAIEKVNHRKESANFYDLVFIGERLSDLTGMELVLKIRKELKLDIPVIMLGEVGADPVLSDSDKSMVDGVLSKPFHPSLLFNSIIDVFSNQGQSSFDFTSHRPKLSTEIKSALKGLRVLVAEDNPTNQDIALEILRIAGMDVSIANNGKEAVKQVKDQQFDVVLMDMQMPEMDGYEATKVIRQEKQYEDLPIIAITAHALKGDKQKCLDAGMNGYISKPITQLSLLEGIYRFSSVKNREVINPDNSQSEAALQPAEFPDTLPGLNIKLSLQRLRLGIKPYVRIAKGFRTNTSRLIGSLKASLEKDNWADVQEISHSIKGSAANIGAEELRERAEGLEFLATAISTNKISQEAAKESLLFQDLVKRYEVVEESIRSLLQQIDPGYEDEAEGQVSENKPLDQLLKELDSALRQAAPIIVKRKISYLKDRIDEETYNNLLKSIREYEYEAALRTLKDIKAN